MHEIPQQVGELIRQRRKSQNLTQKELGEKLGVSMQTINRYESGQNLTLGTFFKVAQALGTTMSGILQGL
ncbi:helix-turn-helix domain-containing protein [Spirosoma sp. HMF4905]|uniref:Helix-turn-helix domain-containing protein n=1 Tax=Spirosoma arboris TaxID=2682092 RepID=A0A7K1S9Z5_9BACT|nr:helix-turn-helix transcriptional regulator [Spirosoma arboris]MVM30478.1 helix-turn-helix domain-containing protein [Spirosoma arboris]